MEASSIALSGEVDFRFAVENASTPSEPIAGDRVTDRQRKETERDGQ